MFAKYSKKASLTTSVVLACLILISSFSYAASSRQILLTWQNDPQTTMTISWRSQVEGRFTYGDQLLWTRIDDAFRDFDPKKQQTYNALEDENITQLLAGKQTEIELEDALNEVTYQLALSYFVKQDEVGAYPNLEDAMTYIWIILRDSQLFAHYETLYPQKWYNIAGDHYYERLLFAKAGDLPLDQFTEIKVIPYSFHETPAGICTVELTDLEPNTEYIVHLTDKNGRNLEKPFTFKTAPMDSEEIVFVSGSDSYRNREMRQMVNSMAAQEEPHFIVFTGDLINDPLEEVDWDEWFDDWNDFVVTDSGRRIPIIPAVGNHEIIGMYDGDKNDAPHYYGRFNLPGNEKYYTINYGPDLTIITLDSQHSSDVAGEQTEWLASTLESYQGQNRWLLAQYHFAAWPGNRSLDEPISVSIRENWLPLFEQGGVRLAMESHDHTFKITKPISGDTVVTKQEGVIFIGDGGWGSPLRDPKDAFENWWLSEISSNHHYFIITLKEDGDILDVKAKVYDDDQWIDRSLFELER